MTGTASSLVDCLSDDGYLPEETWREVFAAVPREQFVPYFFTTASDRPGWRIVEGTAEWRSELYANTVLVTQVGGDDRAVEAARRGEPVYGAPTSSSSAPSLMAIMLHALAVQPGMRVLEIGTGTGYNAGLLSQRLGDERITSVDVDAGLVERARAALTTAGYHPTLVAEDGTVGYPPHAPYDRILATVAVPHIPPAWLDQLTDEGLMVVPLSFAGHGGLMVRLRPTPSGASGHFLSEYGGFMPVRSAPGPDSPIITPDLWDSARPTDVPPEAIRDQHVASFFLSLVCPTSFATMDFFPTGSDVEQTWGQGADASVFALLESEGRTMVAADGPLWGVLEEAYRRWTELGKPTRERFGLTIADGRQWAWLDDPDQLIVDHPQGR